MIIRVKKNKDNPFTLVPNKIINDPRLSYKAKGILIYLISKPDDWEIKMEDIIEHNKDGEDSVRSGIYELIKSGYIVRHRRKKENGKFSGWEMLVYEEPQEAGFQKLPTSDFPTSEKPMSEKPTSEKPALLNTNNIPNTDNIPNTNNNNINFFIEEHKCSSIKKQNETFCTPLNTQKKNQKEKKYSVEARNIVVFYLKELEARGMRVVDEGKFFGTSMRYAENLPKRYSKEEVINIISWGLDHHFHGKRFSKLSYIENFLLEYFTEKGQSKADEVDEEKLLEAARRYIWREKDVYPR